MSDLLLTIQAKQSVELKQENNILESKVQELMDKSKKDQQTIRLLQEQVKHFSQAYRDIAVTSSYPDSEMNNVFEFKKDDKKNQDKITADLIKQFDMFKPKI
ncbi:hypothetical protein [Paenibacillus sp. FSL H8-0034]|uniref:hypothetical protein n=1 Tax=Paenibacillus sp. FSL H8-0034 TaxID=2954671 RepID=UPI0030F8EBB4